MAAAEIPITGVAADFRVPGSYAEVIFNQGPATASAPAREVCFVMPKSSAGSWTAATLNRVRTEQDAIEGAGAGSPLHRAIRMFLSVNTIAKVWAVPVAETSGGSPAAATAEIVFTNSSTGSGIVTLSIAGEEFSFGIPSGASVTDIGDLCEEAINAKTWLPCTASNSSGTVTLTAKINGASQGNGTLHVHRIRASITSGIGTTVSAQAALGAETAGAEGSTTEAANTLTALNAIAARRFYYLVTSAIDATTLGHFKTHLVSKAEPRQGLRSVAISAYPGSLANAQTLATGLNYERLQIAYMRNPDTSVDEIAANVAAVRHLFETEDSSANWVSDSRLPNYWRVKPAFSSADWLDADDQNDAINDGLMPIASRDGASYPVMSVDTRSKNAAGTVDDFRSCETHRVSVADEFTDELLTNTALNFGNGKKLKDDERLADGTVNPNQRRIRNVITPSMVAANVKAQLTDYERDGKIQNAQASKDSLRCVKSPANSSRVECGFDLQAIDHAHQFTYRIAEVSPG